MRRTSVMVVPLLAALLLVAPAAAEAAKLKIAGNGVSVSLKGTAAVGVKNPNGSAARGRLTLRSAGKAIGSKRFSIPARRTRKVKVKLTAGAFNKLRARGSQRVQAVATAAGKGTARRKIKLRRSGGPPGAGAGWRDGRYQGTYAENNANLAFNVVGRRLFTGPFDAFYLESTCQNVDPDYTGDRGLDDASAIEPVEATIAADGSFSGRGVYRTGYTTHDWTITGQIAGGSITNGQFSATHTNTYGNPCSGTTRFTASWYGDYTL